MTDWEFWGVAVLLAATVAVILGAASRRGRHVVAPEASDIKVYKDQLAEIDRDVARGTLADDEARRLRAEVGRRLLAADRALAAGKVLSVGGAGILPVLLIVGAVLGAGLLYWRIGAPGYPDLPLASRLAMSQELMATRPSQAQMLTRTPKATPPQISADFLALMDMLRATVTERPDDLQGLELLSRNEAALGNYAAAEVAQRHLIAVKGRAATGADHANLAEIMIGAVNGFVSPEAEAELVSALQRDPKNASARYYSGVLFVQAGRYDRSFAIWRGLLDEGPDDAPWIAPIRAQMAEVAFRAGINYELPPQKGPTGADVAAAADMTPEDRQTMIETMVAQLSDRLATEGGPVEDWDRLIRSLTVLKKTAQAQAIYDEAKTRFAGRAPELSLLKLAAIETGLVP